MTVPCGDGSIRLRFAGAGASLLMVASRNGPKGGLAPPFGLGVMMLLLLTSEVGYQDLAALIARPPVVEPRAEGRVRLAIRHHPRSQLQHAAAGRRVDPAVATPTPWRRSIRAMPRSPARSANAFWVKRVLRQSLRRPGGRPQPQGRLRHRAQRRSSLRAQGRSAQADASGRYCASRRAAGTPKPRARTAGTISCARSADGRCARAGTAGRRTTASGRW